MVPCFWETTVCNFGSTAFFFLASVVKKPKRTIMTAQEIVELIITGTAGGETTVELPGQFPSEVLLEVVNTLLKSRSPRRQVAMAMDNESGTTLVIEI